MDTQKLAALLASSMANKPIVPQPQSVSGGGDPLAAMMGPSADAAPEISAEAPGSDSLLPLIMQMGMKRNEPPAKPQNRFRAALGRFMEGFSNELTRPEREFQEQKKLGESLIQQRKAMADQMELETVQLPDGRTAYVPRKQLGSVVSAQIGAAGRAADTATKEAGATARTTQTNQTRREIADANLTLRREKINADIERDRQRTSIMERRMNMPQGSLIAEVDGTGEFTGRFYNNKTGSIVTNEALAGGRRTQEPEAVRQRRERIASTQNTIANIRKHSEALARGEDILKNASLLRSQMAYFGQIAKQLGGEVGVLTEQDVARIGRAVPGIMESLLAGSSETFRDIVQAKIEGLEDVFQKVIAARDSKGGGKPKQTPKQDDDLDLRPIK